MPRRVEKYLEYMPVPHSQHVYVGGVEQSLNDDYTIENGSYVIIPNAAEVGDRVEVRYAHLGVPGTPVPTYNTNPDDAKNCNDGPFPWQWNPLVGPHRSHMSGTDLGGFALGDTFTFTHTYGDHSDKSTYMFGATWLHFRMPNGCISSVSLRDYYAGAAGGTYTTTVTLPWSPDQYTGHRAIQTGDVWVGWEIYCSCLTSTGSSCGHYETTRGYRERRV